MSRMGNKVPMLCGVIVLLIGAFLIAAVLSGNRYACVKEGISRAEAERLADEEAQYFLISKKGGGTGIDFVIIYGEYSGADVVLTGNTPGRSLSNVFFLSKPNTFLIKGIEENISNRGVPFDAHSANNYSIEVSSWEIITPIRRDYQYRTNGQKERIFSPSKYLDQFDVEQGDYVED